MQEWVEANLYLNTVKMKFPVARDLWRGTCRGNAQGSHRQVPMRARFLIRFLDLMLATAVFVALT